jgi:hypothetical protein
MILSDEVISEVYQFVLTLVLNTFSAWLPHLVYHMHKSLNCSAGCMEKLRTREGIVSYSVEDTCFCNKQNYSVLFMYCAHRIATLIKIIPNCKYENKSTL